MSINFLTATENRSDLRFGTIPMSVTSICGMTLDLPRRYWKSTNKSARIRTYGPPWARHAWDSLLVLRASRTTLVGI